MAIVLVLPPFPDHIKKSWLFSQREIDFAVEQNKGEKLCTYVYSTATKCLSELNEVGAGFNSSQIRKSLVDPNTYFLAFLSAANTTILASIGVFLPTIVKSFGYTAIHAQLFTIIPYGCAFVSMITIGIISDQYRNKGIFILGCLTVTLVGLIILLTTSTKEAGMAGVSLLVLGIYPAAILQMTWIQITFCGSTKRAVSWGMAMVFGQGFSLLGTQIYTTPPRFIKGHATLLGLVVWGMLSTVAAQLTMLHRNRQREKLLKEYAERGEVHPDVGKSLEETCDSHINFRYTL